MWPDEAPNVRTGHHSFELWWQAVTDTDPTPPPPTPTGDFSPQDRTDVLSIQSELLNAQATIDTARQLLEELLTRHP